MPKYILGAARGGKARWAGSDLVPWCFCSPTSRDMPRYTSSAHASSSQKGRRGPVVTVVDIASNLIKTIEGQ